MCPFIQWEDHVRIKTIIRLVYQIGLHALLPSTPSWRSTCLEEQRLTNNSIWWRGRQVAAIFMCPNSVSGKPINFCDPERRPYPQFANKFTQQHRMDKCRMNKQRVKLEGGARSDAQRLELWRVMKPAVEQRYTYFVLLCSPCSFTDARPGHCDRKTPSWRHSVTKSNNEFSQKNWEKISNDDIRYCCNNEQLAIHLQRRPLQ